MSGFTYDQVAIDAWSDTLRLQAQQKISKLEDKVETRDDVNAEVDHWDRLGSIEFTKDSQRFEDVTFNELPHSRRQVVLSTYSAYIPVSHSDLRRMKADPTDRYIRAGLAAGNRKKDQIILEAALGNATSIDRSNSNAKTLVALPAGQTIAHGSAGLTQDKVDNALQILRDNEVEEDEELYAVITQRQARDLFGESGSKVISRDFNDSQPMISAKIIGMWGGFTWIVSNRVAKSGTTRSCVFFARAGIGFSYNMKSLRVEVKDRPDKKETAQIGIMFDGEATRVEDEMVVEVQCTES